MNKISLALLLTLFLAVSACVRAEPPHDYPWLDDLQSNVTESVHNTANWLDTFFAEDSFQLDQEAHGHARIQLAWEPRSRDLIEFESRVRINWKLPKFKNQVDVVFSDYDDELEKAPVKAAQNDVLSNQNRFNLALRWIQKTDKKSLWSHRVGVGRKLQPFVRSRYTRIFEMNARNNIRSEVSGYFYAKDGLGGHFGLQYEHVMSENSVLRVDNNFYYRDESNDWLWQHGFYGMSQVNEKSAFIYGAYVEGNSKPTYQVTEYLVSTRWRKNALRDWLYFEVEPFILWRRDEDFAPSYGMALRVEGFFGHHF